MSGSCSSQLQSLSSAQPDPTTTTPTVSGILRLGPDELLLLAATCGREAPLVAQLCKGTSHVWLHIRQDARLLAMNLTAALPGWLALQRAVSLGQAQVVRLLLDQGAGRWEGSEGSEGAPDVEALHAVLGAAMVQHVDPTLRRLLASCFDSWRDVQTSEEHVREFSLGYADVYADMPLLVSLSKAVELGHCSVVEAILGWMESDAGSGAWPRVRHFPRPGTSDPRVQCLQYALADAACSGHLDICRLLLRRLGPHVGDALVASRYATVQGHQQVVGALLECVAQGPPGPGSPNAAAAAKLAASLLLCFFPHQQYDDPSCLELLLEWVTGMPGMYSDPIMVRQFQCAIFSAVYAGSARGVRLLLEWVDGWPGAAQDRQEAFCMQDDLCRAALMGHADIPQLLLDRCGINVHWREDRELAGACGRSGRPEVVRQLLERGADVHAADDEALRRACWYGNEAVVRVLLEYGADVNADVKGEYCTWSRKPLLLATKQGQVGVMRLLLAAGADVHAEGGLELLCMACLNGNAGAVQALLEAGADVHAWNDGALMTACGYGRPEGRLEVVRVLLAAGADPDAGGGEPLRIALRAAQLNPRYPLAIVDLLQSGANVNACGCQALQRAVSLGQAQAVRLLLDQGAGRWEGSEGAPDVEALHALLSSIAGDSAVRLPSLRHLVAQCFDPTYRHSQFWWRRGAYASARAHMPLLVSLCRAVELGHCGVVEAILDWMESGGGGGAAWPDVRIWSNRYGGADATDPRVQCLLRVLEDAAYSGHLDICRLLLRRLGPHAAALPCALQLAAAQGHQQVVSALLERVAQGPQGPGSPNAAAAAKLAARLLAYAARQPSEHLSTAQLLLQWADGVPGAAQAPQVALQIQHALRNAARAGHEGITQLLRDRCGTDVPLRNACWDGDEAAVRVLLEHGADVNADVAVGRHVRAWRRKPLLLAAMKAHVGVMRLLLAAGADVHAQGDLSLLVACRSGSVGAVLALLEAGADVHAGNGRALVEACRSDRLAVVSALLAAGADPGAGGGEPLRAALARYSTEFYPPGIAQMLLAP